MSDANIQVLNEISHSRVILQLNFVAFLFSSFYRINSGVQLWFLVCMMRTVPSNANGMCRTQSNCSKYSKRS